MPNYDSIKIGTGYKEQIDLIKKHLESFGDGLDYEEELKPLQEYLGALTSLQEQIEKYTGQYKDPWSDNPDVVEDHVIPFIDEKAKVDLLNQYSKISEMAKGLKEYISNNFKPEEQTVFNDAESKIKGDTHALSTYDPSKGYTNLEYIFESNQKITVNVSDYKLGSVGGAQSSRIPLKYTAPDGKEYDGFFTEPIKFNPKDDFTKKTAELLKENPDLALISKAIIDYSINDIKQKLKDNPEFINHRKFGPEIREKLAGNPPNLTEDEWFYTGMSFLGQYLTKEKKLDESFIIKKVIPAMMKKGDTETKKVAEAFKALVATFAPRKDAYGNPLRPDAPPDQFRKNNAKEELLQIFYTTINGSALHASCGIAVGSRIESRNSALSAVASLLGKSNLIAKSIPMTIQRGDQKFEGTFMATAEGIDPNRRHKDDVNVKYDNLKNTTTLNALADLQVIDFICGNIDRHGGNLFYKYDKDTDKITSVVGIDNDLSFGTFVPKDADDRIQSLSSLTEMKIISESMAQKLESMTKEQLMQTLAPYDLSDLQKEACWKRTDMLKQNIELARKYDPKEAVSEKNIQPPFSIMADEKIPTLDIDALAPLKREVNPRGENIFTRGKNLDLGKFRLKEEYTKQNIENAKDFYGAQAGKKYAEFARDKVHQMTAATNIRGTSTEFENLKRALRGFANFNEKLDGKPFSPTDITLHDKMVDEIMGLADKYLEHHNQKKSPSGYAKDRAKLVTNIKEALQSQKIKDKLTPEDMQAINKREDVAENKRLTEARAKSMEKVLIGHLANDAYNLKNLATTDPEAGPEAEKERQAQFIDAFEKNLVHVALMNKFGDKNGNVPMEKTGDVMRALQQISKGVEHVRTTQFYKDIISTFGTEAAREAYAEHAEQKMQKYLEPTKDKTPEVTKSGEDITQAMGL